jgi:Transposase DDE domain
MATDSPSFTAKDLRGYKYFKLLRPLLQHLHGTASQRDKAGNRQLHFDHYAALILFYFFNPILTSLQGLQQASTLAKVQKALGCPRTSVGSLSEAARVFDAALLREILTELAGQVAPVTPPPEGQALKDLTAVDGSLLPALPRMAWALWVDEGHRAAKLHLAFEVLRGIPTDATVTAGSASEHDQMRRLLQPGRLYVTDRGYAEYQLFQDIIDAKSSFIGRIRENAVWQVIDERPLTPEATAAGVRRDRVVWLGCEQSGKVLRQPLRVIEVATGKKDARGREEVLLLATDRLDLPAELVALGYRFRWSVELFFRWFKCILGCRHLLSTCRNGVEVQVYLGLIASLLISLWTGRKPSKRTYEMVCFYFCGLASETELLAHINRLNEQDEDTS